jgi:hypothetical protein
MSDATSTSVVRTVGDESYLIGLVLTAETVATATSETGLITTPSRDQQSTGFD